MKKLLLLLTLISYINLFASYSTSVNTGWTLLRNNFDNVVAKNIAPNADLIYTYKNNTWYGFSPNEMYKEELDNNNIQSFSTLNSGDAFWVFSSQSSYVTLSGDESIKREVSLKEGWNFVSITGENKYLVPSYYLTLENGVESVWTYDSYTKRWSAYSSIDTIKTSIIDNSSIDLLESLDTSNGLWIKSSKVVKIEITNETPFFKQDEDVYTINEKDMDDFSINALDPNGDAISYTLSGEDKDSFIEEDGNIKFKKINSIPKTQYSISLNASDGNSSIDKSIIINITLRVTNDYDISEEKQGVDPLSYNQWYLDAAYLNIHEVHKTYSGKSENSSIVQIVETGFNIYHPDLIANMDYSMTYDASVLYEDDKGLEGAYEDGFEYHATAVAGIIGARGNNSIGVKGINPFGKLVSFKFGKDTAGIIPSRLDIAWRDGPRANEIDISSNSWGDCTNYETNREKILKDGSETLRDKKGRIYVFSAGNHRIGDESCSKNSANLQNMINNPYSITVASINKNDTIADNSNPGSNILISAYGKDSIWTTSIDGYAGGFGGTSAAAPMVSGGIALLLEACPDLTYRDVKNIIAKSAIQVDSSNPTWIRNQAGYYHSRDYGFGKLNIMGAITMCQNNYTSLDEVISIEKTEEINQNIANNGTTLNAEITINEDINIEWLAISIDGNIENIGEYEFTLTSPSGTTTQLIHGDNASRNYHLNSSEFILQYSSSDVYRLSSQAFLDEKSNGTWIVGISDKNTASFQNNKLLRKVKLEIIGH